MKNRNYSLDIFGLAAKSGRSVAFPLTRQIRIGTMQCDVLVEWAVNTNSQMRKGVVELCVLRVVEMQGEAYGYEIIQRLRELGSFQLTESTVYPLLARLAKSRTLLVRMESSDSGPPRRYYRLSNQGAERLTELLRQWEETRSCVLTLWEQN